MEKLQGVTKWFNKSKGFGFINVNDGSEVFVHQSAILMEGFRKLNDGDVVTFEIGEDSEGRKCAVNVFVVGEGGEE